MDFYGCYFEYSGTLSRQYDLVFANVNTERIASLSGDIQSTTIFSKKSNHNYFIGESFEDSPIRFDAEIVTVDGKCIDRCNLREIEKWLFHQPDYRRLYVDTSCDPLASSCELVNGEEKRLYLNCRLTNPQKIEGNGGIIGYQFTVECDSCMAWQDEIVCEHVLNHNSPESNSIITVSVDTDLNDYVYPKVTIQVGSTGGDIVISNNTDEPSRLTSFVGLSPNVSIVMRGNGVNYISGDNYLKFSGKNFIRLLDGENKIAILGDITSLIFEFQNRRYL